MFSGKSTELARRIRRHKAANRQCLVVKYANDTRYDHLPPSSPSAGAVTLRGCVVTHDRQALTAFPARALAEVDNVVHAYDVIGIDEGQFFGDVAEFCEKWAALGKTVVVAALDADFRRRPFGDILALVPLAEAVDKLTAVCAHCRRDDAAFTKRVGTADEAVELIAGADVYAASCRACHALPADAFGAPRTDAVADLATTSIAGSAGPIAGLTPEARPRSTPLRPPSSASSAERRRARGEKEKDSAAKAGPSPGVTLAAVGEKMRALAMDSPATPAAFDGFAAMPGRATTPSTGGVAGASSTASSKKKARGLGAAAEKAVAEVTGGAGGKRLARGAGGPGRSPMNEFAARGMGAVARSPLANVR
jgi:thymidine kinase